MLLSPSIWMACSSRLLSLLLACCFLNFVLNFVSQHHKLFCCMRLSGKVTVAFADMLVYSGCM